MAWTVVAKYDPNRSGMEEIAKGDPLKIACHSIAAKAMVIAEMLAPEGFENYADNFEVLDEIIADIPFRVRGEPMARVSATLINNGPLAVLVEVGSARSEEYRVMRYTLKWIESQAKGLK